MLSVKLGGFFGMSSSFGILFLSVDFNPVVEIKFRQGCLIIELMLFSPLYFHYLDAECHCQGHSSMPRSGLVKVCLYQESNNMITDSIAQ